MLSRLDLNSSKKKTTTNTVEIHKNVQRNLGGKSYFSIASLNVENFTDTNKCDRITYTRKITV